MPDSGAVEALLVSDLHYDLRKFDWVLERAAEVDLLVAAGDFLDIGSSVPLDAQISVVLEFLSRCAALTTTVACSGNHDLDHRRDDGEKATAWIREAADAGVVADSGTTIVDGWTVTACAWWEGPATLAALEADLAEVAAAAPERWIWAYHGPPEGPLSWTGSRHFGDPELPRLVERWSPRVVLCGHIHQAPYVEGGSWHERLGDTWLFNSGFQAGNVPAHTFFDLDHGRAEWWSLQGRGEVDFAVGQAS